MRGDILLAAILAAAVSYLICRFAISRHWLPNKVVARSSHTKPTSRAGGIAIMVSFAVLALLLSLFSSTVGTDILPLLGLSMAAAALGLADDLWSPSPLVKFSGQAALAVAATLLVGHLNTLPLPLVGVVSLGGLGFIITIIWIIAFMNVFNFMDGLNGIAGGCAVIALAAMTLACAASEQASLAILCILAAAAICGFLALNLPHGKIFLGDSGSHGIGFFLAALAVSAGGIEDSAGSVDAVFLPIIFLPFILDVTITLINRGVRGEKLHEAHKEHIYQRLHQRGFSHFQVAGLYMGLCTISAVMAFLAQHLAPGLKFLAPLALTSFFMAGALIVLSRESTTETSSRGARD
ncbi:MAG: hypothetical protein MRY59_09940 [Aquisalinus sp.]|nr:hypothetical protein [Aquisalinus sp.]